MTETPHASSAQRAEMMRLHNGIVSSIIQGDPAATTAMLRAAVDDHLEASGGDARVFAALMAKQIEAGARVHIVTLRALATRLDRPVDEVHETLAAAAIEKLAGS